MKSLTLFRHAKTERDSSTGRDFDRVLTERGRNDAARIGAEIRDLRLEFDMVLVSPAARAAETSERAGIAAPQYDPRIYDASVVDLLAIVRKADDGVGRLMIVGHNPGFERLASVLIGNDIEMPAGSLIEIEMPANHWRDVDRASGQSVRFLKPEGLV